MNPRISAGCVVTREGPDGTEILLVHARGATFKRPLFGIPKGAVEVGESPLQAAVRETREESGLRVDVRAALGTVRQKSGKTVHAFWATIAAESADRIDGNGRCRRLDGENDVCRFYPLARARELMIPAQLDFIDRLREVQAGTRDLPPEGQAEA